MTPAKADEILLVSHSPRVGGWCEGLTSRWCDMAGRRKQTQDAPQSGRGDMSPGEGDRGRRDVTPPSPRSRKFGRLRRVESRIWLPSGRRTKEPVPQMAISPSRRCADKIGHSGGVRGGVGLVEAGAARWLCTCLEASGVWSGAA